MSYKRRPTHQGLYLTEHTTAEMDKPKPTPPFVPDPKDAAIMAAHLRLFIDRWLPKMLHEPETRVSVEIGQDVASFDHMPLVVRSDVLKFPEAERIADKMLVRFGWIDLTKQLHRR